MDTLRVSLDDLTREYINEIDSRLTAVAGCAEQKINIPEKLGRGKNYLIKVSSDIDLMVSESNFFQDVCFEASSPDMCGAIIVIEGECRMKMEHSSVEHRIKSGQAMLFIMRSSVSSVRYPKGNVKMLNFSVPKSLIAQFNNHANSFPIVKEEGDYKITEDVFISVPVSPALREIIQQVYQANLIKEAQNLFINAKVIEMLAQIYHTSNERVEKYPGVKASDLESIMDAAKIIEQEMHNPPSIIELAHRVGINDNKLKNLFKTVFNNTVYGYLKEKRMQAAHRLLSDTDMSVQQISEKVGLKHGGHFSKVFSEKYGVLPADIKRLRAPVNQDEY
ncbi:AraC family transcriptional regulator [Oceanimonas baumannii]|uniref:helix-turn-helix domain-containing protein n=1 Tax=Oceanimonas baumannii TaxID=129578 RepID=UPI001D185108|nr:AraC family transcriptional regulator [Oceanimonas baumannii]MCC4264762.1 AraC family transcriptional regulator [Oceanimonas baumannii]